MTNLQLLIEAYTVLRKYGEEQGISENPTFKKGIDGFGEGLVGIEKELTPAEKPVE